MCYLKRAIALGFGLVFFSLRVEATTQKVSTEKFEHVARIMFSALSDRHHDALLKYLRSPSLLPHFEAEHAPLPLERELLASHRAVYLNPTVVLPERLIEQLTQSQETHLNAVRRLRGLSPYSAPANGQSIERQ